MKSNRSNYCRSLSLAGVLGLPIIANCQSQVDVMAGLEARKSACSTFRADVFEHVDQLGQVTDTRYSYAWSKGRHFCRGSETGDSKEFVALSDGTKLLNLIRDAGADKWSGIFTLTPNGPGGVQLGMLEGSANHHDKPLADVLRGLDFSVTDLQIENDYGRQIQVKGSTNTETFSLVLAPERGWLCVSSDWTNKDVTSKEMLSVGQIEKINDVWVPSVVTQKSLLKHEGRWKTTYEAARTASHLMVGDSVDKILDIGSQFGGTVVIESGTSNPYRITDSGQLERLNAGPAGGAPLFQLFGLWLGIVGVAIVPGLVRRRSA